MVRHSARDFFISIKTYIVHLTRTEKKGKEGKSRLMDQVRQASTTKQHIYLFRVQNMRNSLFKSLRACLEGRFFIGKNRVMAIALGHDESSELLPGISHLTRGLKGDLGLLCTDVAPNALNDLFASRETQVYARTGNLAIMTVVIEADDGGLRNVATGELLSATQEPQLRQAGVPTKLRGGAILLSADNYTVCSAGEQLTVDQARILKIFGIKMATFKVELAAHYHNGTYEEYELEELAVGTTRNDADMSDAEVSDEAAN